ncbi:MAG: hypothetical protein ACLQVA_14295 [Candidatus Brocadiia bacterium]
MNLRSMALRLGIACILAGILAAPLAAQTANNPTLTNTSTAGVQPANDLLPLLVVLTGPQNWAYIGSATGVGIGTNGGGGGQWIRIMGGAQAPAVPTPGAQALEPVASITTTDGRTFKDVRVFALVPHLGDGLIIGDRVLLIDAAGSETVALDSLPDEARKSLGLEAREEQASFEVVRKEKRLVKSGNDWVAPAEKRRREREAKFWADLSLLVPDWRELGANPAFLDWVMEKDLGDALDRQERARARAKWQVASWEPWQARNVDPVTGRPWPWAEPLPRPPY